MLKTLNELEIKPVTGKFLSPEIKQLNNILFQFNNTPVNTVITTEIIDKCTNILKTNNNTHIQLILNKLNMYVSDFQWDSKDKDILQRMINYSVAYWIKTKENNDTQTVIKHLERWRYVKETVEFSPFVNELRMESFNRLNKDLLKVLEERYK